MASEFDNEIGKEQQQDAPQNAEVKDEKSYPEFLSKYEVEPNDEGLLPLEDDEEQEVWGDDDEDLEPPPNPLDIDDEESKFIDDEGVVEEPAKEDDSQKPNDDNGKQEEPSQEPDLRQQQTQPKPTTYGAGNSDEEYIRKNIDSSFIPGTNEFFEAVENEAKSAVENSTGEEFDEFNPQHISRYNYYVNQCAKKREDEMHRGIEWCRKRDARIIAEQNAKKVEKEFGDFLNKQITSPELANKFQEACDNLTVRQTREINARIEKGDYTGVQRIIDSIKGQRGTSKPRYASQNPLPRRNVSSGSNAPKLSDIL